MKNDFLEYVKEGYTTIEVLHLMFYVRVDEVLADKVNHIEEIKKLKSQCDIAIDYLDRRNKNEI